MLDTPGGFGGFHIASCGICVTLMELLLDKALVAVVFFLFLLFLLLECSLIGRFLGLRLSIRDGVTGGGVVVVVGPVYAARWRVEGMRERLVMLRVIHREFGYRRISGRYCCWEVVYNGSETVRPVRICRYDDDIGERITEGITNSFTNTPRKSFIGIHNKYNDINIENGEKRTQRSQRPCQNMPANSIVYSGMIFVTRRGLVSRCRRRNPTYRRVTVTRNYEYLDRPHIPSCIFIFTLSGVLRSFS